jgi:hypothetical protein
VKNLFYLILLLPLVSCDLHLELSQPDDVFIIPEGQHSSTSFFRGFDGNSMTFEAKFNQTAVYKTVDPANQADINKLMGFSACGSFHHENSARFGWRWYNNELEILAYAYINGVRVHKLITSVPLDTYVTYEITRKTNGYYFKVGETTIQIMAAANECAGSEDYILWPYFGGDETAPHKVEIYIQSIKQHEKEDSEEFRNEG